LVTLKPRLQELLGLNLYPPFVGMIDGRSAPRFLSQRLKTNQNSADRVDMGQRILNKKDKIKFKRAVSKL